jgi:hypothetical protein
MVVDEKLLELLDEGLPEIIYVFHVSVSVVHQFDGYDTVIALGIFLVLALLALDNSYWPTLDQASGIRRLVHQYQDVDGITVFRFG